jgi:hypothetical protein
VITRPLVLDQTTIHINADARGGEIRVGLLYGQGKAVTGYGIEDCVPLTGDILDGEVTWNLAPEESMLARRPRALQISLRPDDLYSLWAI